LRYDLVTFAGKRRKRVRSESKGGMFRMTADPVPPKFLFFPRLTLDRLRRKRRENRGTGFVSTMEMFITLAVCVVLAAIGLPSALTRGSIVGWVLSVLGVGGMILLTIMSIGSQWGSRPSYDDFLAGIFFFFVSLGVILGFPAGKGAHSALIGIVTSLAGLIAGYLLGILAGMKLQHLGWIAAIINMLAGLFAIVIAGGALILLLGSLA
jgi:hypothetical protein